MFLAKVADAALSTTKTILIQRSRWIIAGIVVMVSDMIYFWINVIMSDDYEAMKELRDFLAKHHIQNS